MLSAHIAYIHNLFMQYVCAATLVGQVRIYGQPSTFVGAARACRCGACTSPMSMLRGGSKTGAQHQSAKHKASKSRAHHLLRKSFDDNCHTFSGRRARILFTLCVLFRPHRLNPQDWGRRVLYRLVVAQVVYGGHHHHGWMFCRHGGCCGGGGRGVLNVIIAFYRRQTC